MQDRLTRLILVRHGETAGQSSIRYYGVTDVPLSELGREQIRAAKERIPGETYDAVWASTLCRSWEAAQIIAPSAPVRLDFDFREIDFGDWEGLTREEIAEVDPEGYAEWQASDGEFHFPGGESRAAFRERIARGYERLVGSGARSPLVVCHKGVVRTLLELATGFTLAPEHPDLGAVIHASRDAGGAWTTGRRGSDSRCGEAGLGIPLA
ncbi:MAG: histidine phosphatase family protein [Myxococcota bacterium]